jgi:transmembrane sensor
LTTGGGKSVEDLEAEAAAWAIKLDAGPDRPPPGLDAWCAQSPRHAGALLRAQAALALFDPVSNPVSRGEDAPADANKFSPWKRWTIAGAGTAALAASFAAVLLIRAPGERYETQIGEVRSVALSDGSSVSIDAKSRIEIAYGATSRDVRIFSGKALFHAVHNPERPFRVIVDDVVVTDVGTTFQVADDDPTGDVDVLVTQGTVRVDSPAGQLGLTTGQRARFSKLAMHGARSEPLRVASADIDRMLAWRDGRLELDGETLDSAVADINRHSRLQLRVGAAELGRQSLYGSFRMDDAAGFARAAALSLGTGTRTEPDGIVIGPGKSQQDR